ncbi:hypothetical protein [Deinococcus multiflagellatus]|uniref:Uncharacterized protein n=1 Tax=Deinococcus multiflagellatus TaxID=1656887 RepID=A0ABW1ZQM6_9DEIO
MDEHSKVPRADSVHAALSANTDVIVYGGTPHGRNNLFARIAHNLIPGDPWEKFTFNWRDNPDKNYALDVPAANSQGTEVIYPWYLFEKSKSVDQALFEQEVDISYDAETKNQIILGAWVQAARALKLEGTLPLTAGLDVGDTGPDATTYASRAGPAVTRMQALNSEEAPQETHELATRDGVDLLQYDRNGVGAAIAATVARRTDRTYQVRGSSTAASPAARSTMTPRRPQIFVSPISPPNAGGAFACASNAPGSGWSRAPRTWTRTASASRTCPPART